MKNVVGFRYTKDGCEVAVRESGAKRWISVGKVDRYLFIDKQDIDKIDKSLFKNVIVGKKYVKCIFDGNWKTIVSKMPVQTYEADVSIERRWFIDNKVEFGKQRILYYDIEQDDTISRSKEDRLILSISVCDREGFNHTFVNESLDEYGEKIMLSRFVGVLNEYDLLIGWNSQNYDDAVINTKLIKYFSYDLSTIGIKSLDLMKLFEKYWGTGAEVKKSLSLDNVSKEVLGESKVKFEGSILNLFKSDRNKFLEYNKKDVELLKKLDDKTGFVDDAMVLANICNCLLENNSIMSSYLVDGYLLKAGLSRGYRFKTKSINVVKDENEDEPSGAFCANFKTGLLKDVEVYDFKSLYPNLILTFNISPDTKLPKDYEGECYIAGNGVKFRKDIKGIFTELVETALNNREMYKKEGKDRIANAWKILANSLAGVTALPSSRYYDVDIFEAITKSGSELIQLVIDKAKSIGIDVVFSDTDSVAVIKSDKSQEIGKKEFIDEIVKRRFGVDNKYLIMKYEGIFDSIIITTKKRYIAKRDGKLVVKGLEIVRTDTCKMARELQKDIAVKILDGMDKKVVFDTIEAVKSRCYQGKLDVDDIVIYKKISKEEYKSDLIHTKIANRIKELGKDVYIGMKIGYVITQSSPNLEGVWVEEYDKNVHKYDMDYYWNKLIYPPVERILSVVYKDDKDYIESLYGGEVMKKIRRKKIKESNLDLFEQKSDESKNESCENVVVNDKNNGSSEQQVVVEDNRPQQELVSNQINELISLADVGIVLDISKIGNGDFGNVLKIIEKYIEPYRVGDDYQESNCKVYFRYKGNYFPVYAILDGRFDIKKMITDYLANIFGVKSVKIILED